MALQDIFEKSGYKDYDKWLDNRKKQKKKYLENLSKYVEELKTPCLFCGAGDVLFHHINANEKSFELGKYKRKTRKQIKEEVDKCWCLCEDCHIKLHQRLIDPLPSCYANQTP